MPPEECHLRGGRPPMPPTDQEIADAGQKLFEMFGACG
jgi:hypothetical protein